jgi:hypothetical protein
MKNKNQKKITNKGLHPPKNVGFWKLYKDYYSSIISGLLATIIVHRNIIFTASLPGDSIDARATVVTYEHWYMFLKGESFFREIPVFYPTENLISSSDAVLGQGLVYSILRFFGMGQTISLKATIVMITTIGFIGVAALAKLIFKDTLICTGITALTVTSYQVVAQSGHLQTWLYFSLAWVLFFLIKIYRNADLPTSFSGLIICLPLLALSAWYIIIGLIWFSGLICVYLFLRDKRVLSDGLATFKISGLSYLRSSTKLATTSLTLFLIQIFTFAYIYLERIGDQEFGGWATTSFYSPRLFDLFNASFGSTGWQADIYEKVKLDIYPTAERAMGLSIPVIILIVFGFVYILRKNLQLTSLENSLVFAVIATFIIPLTDERGQSLWYFVSKIPIINSIRTPARLWIYASILISWLIVWFIWKNLNRQKLVFKSKLSLFILIGVLSLAQIKTPMANWKESDLLSNFGKEAKVLILQNKCEVFYLSSAENLGIYDSIVRQIDGMLIAVTNNKKTINGYTSSPPIGWPQRPVWGLVAQEELVPWIALYPKLFSQKTCFINEEGLTFYDPKSKAFIN